MADPKRHLRRCNSCQRRGMKLYRVHRLDSGAKYLCRACFWKQTK